MDNTKTTEVSGAGEHYLIARKRRRRRNVLVLVGVVAVAAGGWYWHQSRETVVEDQPLIVTIGYGDIENTIAAAGKLEPSRIVDVGAQVSGQLQRLYVEVGDYVEEGELLAEIDARVQANRVRASEASIDALRSQVQARQAALDLARQNAERQERLWRENATSELEYQNARNSYMSAQASLEQLIAQIQQNEASLETEKTQLEFTQIKAPLSGTVVEVLLTEGVTLNANQSTPTILRIADLSTMTVKTEISEADIGRIHEGMDVYFTTLGGGQRRWYGKLEQILPSPTTENNVVLYPGLFDVDNTDGALRSGMTTQVYFVTSAAYDVLTVPLGALTFKDAPGRGAAGRVAGGTAAQGGMAGGRAGGFPQGGFPQGGFPQGGFPQGGFPRGDFPRGEGPPPEFPAGAFRGPGGDGGPGELAGPRGGFGGAAAGGFAGRPAGGAENVPRAATVRVVHDDGTIEEREILVGVMSRVSAEVISGLEPGDRVIAGIVQAEAPDEQSRNNDNRDRGFRGPPGMRFF